MVILDFLDNVLLLAILGYEDTSLGKGESVR